MSFAVIFSGPNLLETVRFATLKAMSVHDDYGERSVLLTPSVVLHRSYPGA